MYYDIPLSLSAEIDELDSVVRRYRKGGIDAESLKACRVPFGCYEQRENGTYMLRIRCPGGALTPVQLRSIGTLSKRFGRDSIHITTRQEFQIHDVKLENVVPVMRQLLKVGLSTRGGGGNTVRNIIVSPEAGISTDEGFDPSPYAFALTSRLLAEPGAWELPRKFKIAFSGNGRDCAGAQFNDLGFIVAIRSGEFGFRVYVAGGLGTRPEVGKLLHGFIPAKDVYLVSEAIRRVFNKYGNRGDRNAARLRFLWKQVGEDRFRRFYEWELEQLRGEGVRPLQLLSASHCSVMPPLRPLEDHSADFRVWRDRYVVAQRRPGFCSVLVPVFLGNLKNERAITLASFLESFGTDVVRATLRQNLRLRNIPEQYLGNVYAVVKEISELAAGPALLANSIACTGADTCKLGICLSKGALRAIAEKLEGSGLDLDELPDFKLNISGCPNSCGHHVVGDMGFYGKVGHRDGYVYPAYGVVAGAIVRAGEAQLARYLGQVNARSLPDFVRDVLEVWIQKKHRFTSFAAYIESEGGRDFAGLFERYRDIPVFETDNTFVFDWGASQPFSLAARRPGECSAGPGQAAR